MMTDNEFHYDTASLMMEHSRYHCGYSLSEKRAYIEPPLSMGNYIFGVDAEGVPYLFATWAFPNPRQVDEYLKTGVFPPSAWRGDGDTPWVVDFICFAGRAGITEGFRSLKDIFTEMGYSECYWLRTESKKLGFHKLKEN
jgi:hemolysin-activating ACP:hemolysin acyltransferase